MWKCQLCVAHHGHRHWHWHWHRHGRRLHLTQTELLDESRALDAHLVEKDAHGVAHLDGAVERLAAVDGALLGLEERLGEAEVLARERMIVDAALDELSILAAHLLEKLFAHVVVQIGKGDLGGRHRTHPVLVVLELGHRHVQRLQLVVATLAHAQQQARILATAAHLQRHNWRRQVVMMVMMLLLLLLTHCCCCC